MYDDFTHHNKAVKARPKRSITLTFSFTLAPPINIATISSALPVSIPIPIPIPTHPFLLL